MCPKWPNDPARLEVSRQEFAQLAIDIAASCTTNQEFMNRFRAELPESLLFVDQGRTRNVFGYRSLGVCIKVQRENTEVDPLHPDDVRRDCDGDVTTYLRKLHASRMVANLQEIAFAIEKPSLMPRQYGVLCSFGTEPSHPSILVTEIVTPLSRIIGGERMQQAPLRRADIVTKDGRIVEIYDTRLTEKLRRKELESSNELPQQASPDIQTANLGRTSAGGYVLLDASDFACAALLLNETTFLPKGWTLFDTQSPEANKEFSASLFKLYVERRTQLCDVKMVPPHLCPKHHTAEIATSF